MARNGKRYSQEFKDGVIRMIRDNGQSVASVAKDVGVREQTIYRWLDQNKAQQQPDKVRIMELEAQLKESKRRVGALEESVTILKKATAIFATQNRK